MDAGSRFRECVYYLREKLITALWRLTSDHDRVAIILTITTDTLIDLGRPSDRSITIYSKELLRVLLLCNRR